MAKKCHVALISVILVLFLEACSIQKAGRSLLDHPYPAPQDLPSANETSLRFPVAPVHAPQPNPGKASISGTLYSYTLSRVIPETMFYLTRAVGDDNRKMPTWLIGPEVEKGDIRGWTDANGQFALNNIPPGNYYLIVWAPYDWIPAVSLSDDSSPRLIELPADRRQVLGIVYVPWP